jgi:SAM-dependent methyltransferase
MRWRRRSRPDQRAAVGGHWDDVGRLQFDTLVGFGLRPEHRLVDVPCGSFRVGRLLIPYLDRGNYIGVEADPALIAEGRKVELGRRMVREKRPQLIARRMPAPLPDADIVWIHALFDHIPPADTVETIRYAGAAAPRVFGSFFLTDTPDEPKRWLRYGSEEGAIVTYPDQEYWHHSRQFVSDAAQAAGLQIAGWHEYGHPLSLTMVEFGRA